MEALLTRLIICAQCVQLSEDIFTSLVSRELSCKCEFVAKQFRQPHYSNDPGCGMLTKTQKVRNSCPTACLVIYKSKHCVAKWDSTHEFAVGAIEGDWRGWGSGILTESNADTTGVWGEQGYFLVSLALPHTTPYKYLMNHCKYGTVAYNCALDKPTPPPRSLMPLSRYACI